MAHVAQISPFLMGLVVVEFFSHISRMFDLLMTRPLNILRLRVSALKTKVNGD